MIDRLIKLRSVCTFLAQNFLSNEVQGLYCCVEIYKGKIVDNDKIVDFSDTFSRLDPVGIKLASSSECNISDLREGELLFVNYGFHLDGLVE